MKNVGAPKGNKNATKPTHLKAKRLGNVRLPAWLIDELKLCSAQSEVSMGEMVATALVDFYGFSLARWQARQPNKANQADP